MWSSYLDWLLFDDHWFSSFDLQRSQHDIHLKWWYKTQIGSYCAEERHECLWAATLHVLYCCYVRRHRFYCIKCSKSHKPLWTYLGFIDWQAKTITAFSPSLRNSRDAWSSKSKTWNLQGSSFKYFKSLWQRLIYPYKDENLGDSDSA